MKVCFHCKKTKDLNEYYKHNGMSDGRLNKCKDCVKISVRAREKEKRKDKDWVEKEKARGREKYHRLGYRFNSWDNKNKYKTTKKYREKYPEKYKAIAMSQRVECPEGKEKHHWSYSEENAKDVILLAKKDHYTLHRFIKYKQEEMIYYTINGTRLDTREKHEAYASGVLNLPF